MNNCYNSDPLSGILINYLLKKIIELDIDVKIYTSNTKYVSITSQEYNIKEST